jgi:uncharacterized protein YmfQ (DUF2313 family)
MARTSDDYLHDLQALLPPGPAWPRDLNAQLTKLLQAEADGLARVDARTDDLKREMDPRTATEMLPDWEDMLGLPDPCIGPLPTILRCQQAITAKIVDDGGQTAGHYIAVAALFGYEISVTTFQCFTCETACEEPIYDEPWRFAAQINAPLNTIQDFTCVSGCDEPLRTWGNTTLECVLNRRKQSHTHLIFAYS